MNVSVRIRCLPTGDSWPVLAESVGFLANYVLTDPRPQPADWSKQIQSERHWERSSARFELVYYHTMFGWFLNHGPPLYFLPGREAQRRALGVVVRCLHLVACGAAPPLVSSS